jgi:mannose/fructose/N-acetylgalactosamine-specific phosphotransferase system component IIC
VTTAEAGLAIGAGALLSLERKALVQLMLSRPIVVAPLLAGILGHGAAGLWVGIPLELFFLGSASYGASTPEHETLAALFAAAVVGATAGVGPPPTSVLAVALYLSLPLAMLGRRAEAALEKRSIGLVDVATGFLDEGRTGRAARTGLVAMVGTALLGAGAVVLGLLVGSLAATLETHLGAGATRGLSFAWTLFLGVSAAMGLRFAVFALTTLALR